MPSSVNRINFRKLYAVCCCAKYVTEKSFRLLLNSDIVSDSYISFLNKKYTAESFLKDFLKARFPNTDPTVTEDFIIMAFKLKEKIDCSVGKKKLYQLHSEYSERLTLNAMRGKKFEIPDTPLRYLSLPENYNIFRTKKAFAVEGTINHNCVASYIDKVVRGNCLCCCADIDGRHYTIEIVCRKKGKSYLFSAVQIRGKYNSEPDPCIKRQIEQDLENATQQSLEKFAERKRKKKEKIYKKV